VLACHYICNRRLQPSTEPSRRPSPKQLLQVHFPNQCTLWQRSRCSRLEITQEIKVLVQAGSVSLFMFANELRGRIKHPSSARASRGTEIRINLPWWGRADESTGRGLDASKVVHGCHMRNCRFVRFRSAAGGFSPEWSC
jgi:hypothetical protein